MQHKEKTADKFTRARYAAWAGDVEHCRDLLKIIQLESRKLPRRNYSGAFGLMLRAATQLSDRIEIQQKRSESGQQINVHERHVITSKHLRAVVHRISEFEFELRAYLDDLSWEESLYRRALAIGEAKNTLAPQADPILREQFETTQGQIKVSESLRRPHPSWRMVDQNLVCVVSVGPFCLIKMKGTWTRLYAPRHIDEVIKTFQRALYEIDPEEQHSSHFTSEQVNTKE